MELERREGNIETEPKDGAEVVSAEDDEVNVPNPAKKRGHQGLSEHEPFLMNDLPRKRPARKKAKWYVWNFRKFWSDARYFLWTLFVDAFYIPPYRWEWGEYRNWSLEATESRRKSLRDPEAVKQREKRRWRREFIKKRRKEAEDAGTILDKHEGCRRVRINCSGTIFETQARTLQRFPDTLLGDEERFLRYWNPERKEYFLDRNPECFESIIHFYQTLGSSLERPQHARMEDFQDEIRFFDLKGPRVDEILEEDEMDGSSENKMPVNLFKRKLWLLLEYPTSSKQARLFSYFSILAILLSTVVYCMDTMTAFRGPYSDSIEVVDLQDPLFFIESTCVTFFALEYLGRFWSCPNRLIFAKGFANIIDIISIMPLVLQLLLFMTSHEHMVFGHYRVSYISFEEGSLSASFRGILKLIRVFRILKLSRYSLGLRILGKTLHASFHELGLLAFFLMVGVIIFSTFLYFIESYFNPESNLESIPLTFFWAVSTMTTTGYDKSEELPKTLPGKLVGSLCAVAGVLTLSLPVPVVVANFSYFYHHGTKGKEKEKKLYVRSCPFRPTCEEDHAVEHPSKVLARSSKTRLKQWDELTTERKSKFPVYA